MRRSRILRLGMVTSYFSWRNRALLGILYHLKFLAKAAVTRATQSSGPSSKIFRHPSVTRRFFPTLVTRRCGARRISILLQVKGGHALHVPWQRRSRPLRLIAPRPLVIMPILSCDLLLRQYLPLSDFGGGLILSSRRSLNLMLGTAEVFCRGLSGQMFRVSLCNIASYKRREFFEI